MSDTANSITLIIEDYTYWNPTLEGSTVWCVSGKWPGGGSKKLKFPGIPGVYKPHARDCRSHEVVLPSTLFDWIK